MRTNRLSSGIKQYQGKLTTDKLFRLVTIWNNKNDDKDDFGDDFDDDDDADDVSDQSYFPSRKDCQSKGPNTQLLWIYITLYNDDKIGDYGFGLCFFCCQFSLLAKKTYLSKNAAHAAQQAFLFSLTNSRRSQ